MFVCPHCNKECVSFFRKALSRQSMPVVCKECGEPSFLDRKRSSNRVLIDFIRFALYFGILLFLVVNGAGLMPIITSIAVFFVSELADSIYWRYKAPLIVSCEFKTTWARRSNAVFFGLVGLLVIFILVKNSS